MRNHTTPEDLAKVLARNPSLKLCRIPPPVKLRTESPCTVAEGLVGQRVQTSTESPEAGGKAAKARRDYKAGLVQQCQVVGLPPLIPEFKMFEGRRFKADFRVGTTRILVEYEGGIFRKTKQGHDSVTGILRDITKYNLCAIDGWIVIRVTAKHVETGQALAWIEAAVKRCSPAPE